MPATYKETEVPFTKSGGNLWTGHGRILILSLTCGCLVMIAAAWWYYTRQRQAMEGAAVRELAAVADVESSQIANWRRERIGDGRVLMSSPVMTIARRILSSTTASDAHRAGLMDLMSRLARQFLYTDIALVELDGSVRIRLHVSDTDSSQLRKRVRESLAREAGRAKDVVLSDLSLDTRSGRPLMFVTVPVQDLGAFILDIDPSSFLYPYLASWPGPSLTAETLLVRRQGDAIEYLHDPRHVGGRMLLFLTAQAGADVPSLSHFDSGLPYQGPDYRGVPVLASVRRVPDSPWFLIAKIDSVEVDTPLRLLAWQMALITALIGLANAAGVGLIWRDRRARIHHQREAWFYSVANDTPAYLWMASADEENSFINRPLGEFLGTDKQSLSKNWSDYLHPDDAGPARARFLECIATGRAYTDEFRIRRFDGAYRWVVDEAVPRFSPSGEFIGYAGALLDITERKQAEEQLRSANASLATELAERTRNEQEIQALSARLIGAQEEERKRLARELHDDLNQQIAALSIAMGNLKRHIPVEQADARAHSDRIHQKLVQLAETVRRMSHDLHPAILQYSGLAAALQSYCQAFGAVSSLRVSLRIEGSFDGVSASSALCIYRITQEALQNVAKHAHVETAAVQLTRAQATLRLTVSDEGAGMELAGTRVPMGLGLVSIKERVRLVNGKLEIRSKPNAGTTITVSIPD